MPSDPVARPVASLTATRKHAAATLSSAVRCWAWPSLGLRSAVGCSGPAAAIALKGRAAGRGGGPRPPAAGRRRAGPAAVRVRGVGDPVLDRAEPLDLHAHDVAVLEELRRVH